MDHEGHPVHRALERRNGVGCCGGMIGGMMTAPCASPISVRWAPRAHGVTVQHDTHTPLARDAPVVAWKRRPQRRSRLEEEVVEEQKKKKRVELVPSARVKGLTPGARAWLTEGGPLQEVVLAE